MTGSGKVVVELEGAAGLTTTHSQEQVAVAVGVEGSSSRRQKRSYESANNPPPVINKTGCKRSILTQEEKKEKKARRMLANRQAAKRSNLRQKALPLELKQKVAELFQENRRLKKEMELTLKLYNSLNRESLQLNKAAAAAAGGGKTEIRRSNTRTAPPPVFLHNYQAAPFFWPPYRPTSFYHSQFQMPFSSPQTQHLMMGNTWPAAPLLVYPVSCFFPFLPPPPPPHNSRPSCSNSPSHDHTNIQHQPPGQMVVFRPVSEALGKRGRR